MTAFLLKLSLGALFGIAVLRAAWPRTAKEVHRFQLLQRRAEWLTVAFGVVAALFLVSSAYALPIGDRAANPLGLLAFLGFWIVIAAAVSVLRPRWRAVREEHARHLRSEGALASQSGIQETPPPPHRGLSGQEPPPTRW